MRKATLIAALALATTLAGSLAVAQDTPAGTIDAPIDEGGYVPKEAATPTSLSVLDVVGKLVIALAVAYGVVRVVRWWYDGQLSSRTEGGRSGRRMWVEETLSLGADGRLYLVEVEGRRMLLSGGDGGVVEIADLTDEPVRPSAYRSVRRRADGSTDELNVAQAGISTRSVRPDVVESDESWEQRRGRLLRELQEQG